MLVDEKSNGEVALKRHKCGHEKGVTKWCAECARVKSKARYAAMSEDEKQVVRDRSRVWEIANRDRKNERARAYRLKNGRPDTVAYRTKNREAINARAKAKRDADRSAHNKKASAYATDYRWTISGRSTGQFQAANKRAKDRGLEFSLTHEFVKEKINGMKCEATGLPLSLATSKSRGEPIFTKLRQDRF
jgi:hypothetical protein